jgi:hypothetical protein
VGQTLKTAAGFDRSWATTLLNAGVPTPYPADATIDAAVWRGGNEATLFSPSAAWIDAAAGTLTVSVVAAQTVGLDPGVYRLQVGVTSGSVRSLAFDGHLEILEAPGAGTLRVPYVTYRDLLDYFDQLGTLQSVPGDDATFLRQRSRASDQFDRDLVVRYDPRPGFVRTRRASMDPYLGFDVPDPAAVPPTPRAVSLAVRAGGVVVDENVREMVSKLAIARVLEQQEVMGMARNPYEEKAAAFHAEAMGLWQKYDVQLDTSNPLDGVADLLVGRDVILLPTGTAP